MKIHKLKIKKNLNKSRVYLAWNVETNDVETRVVTDIHTQTHKTSSVTLWHTHCGLKTLEVLGSIRALSFLTWHIHGGPVMDFHVSHFSCLACTMFHIFRTPCFTLHISSFTLFQFDVSSSMARCVGTYMYVCAP